MDVVELCAGAGGQALGLERAGFEHRLAVELDAQACMTLRFNRDKREQSWDVEQGDVADPSVWTPQKYKGVDLLAAGVPCPPFSVAGKQLGATDERDLFAWTVETCLVMKPRALLLENVRGLSEPRFGAYREYVLQRLSEKGYVGEWRLLQASDYGVPQLRPRFVLVAMQAEDMAYFSWPEPLPERKLVGSTLLDLMSENDWEHAEAWRDMASDIAPTIVGGSKKHGGADLGPTRAKRAWRALGVDGMGIANEGPRAGDPHPDREGWVPKLTNRMVQRLQGWDEAWGWEIKGKKTSTYRQIGNAFPPPVAEAVGRSIRAALLKEGSAKDATEIETAIHDGLYRVLRNAEGPLTVLDLTERVTGQVSLTDLERRLKHLSRDFAMIETDTPKGTAYALGDFKAFTGQEVHVRHEYMAKHKARIS